MPPPISTGSRGGCRIQAKGRWTAIAAIDEGVPAPCSARALYSRFASRDLDLFANKVLSAMRKEFGGHDEKRPAVTLEVEVLRRRRRGRQRAAAEVASLAREPRRRRPVHVRGQRRRTPWAMFATCARLDVPWEQIEIYQVDERVAPAGDPDRNLTHLIASLPPVALGQSMRCR